MALIATALIGLAGCGNEPATESTPTEAERGAVASADGAVPEDLTMAVAVLRRELPANALSMLMSREAGALADEAIHFMPWLTRKWNLGGDHALSEHLSAVGATSGGAQAHVVLVALWRDLRGLPVDAAPIARRVLAHLPAAQE